MRFGRLIIECKSCDTRFRLDESRIPAQGARVRCSRCKTAFFVANPEASQQEALDEVVAEVTDPGGAVGPGATQDLFEAGGADLGDSVVGGKAAAGQAGVAPNGDDDELWEFEDSVPTPAPAEAAAPPALDPNLAETQAAAPPPQQVAQTGQVPSTNESGLDLAETLDEGATREPTADTLVSEDSGLDPMAGPDPAELTSTAPATDGSLNDDVEGPAGLGAPEDWDFLGESSESMAEAATFTDEGQPEPQVDQVAIVDRVAIVDQVAVAAESDIFAERDSEKPIGEPIAAAVVADPAPHSASPKASRRWQRPSLVPSANTVGWVLAGAFLLLGLSRALVPSLPATLSEAEPRSFEFSLGEAKQVTGRFIDNAWVGPVFVVEGMYEPMETPSGPTTLRLRWLDADGKPIGNEVAAVAGDGLGQRELRELRPSAAAALLAATGPDFRFGGTFSLVPGAIPADAADFDLVLEVKPAVEEEALDPSAEAG